MPSEESRKRQSIRRMLEPASIAVVGATPRPQYGGRFLRSVLESHDRVRVYPVNPRYPEILGVPCYPSLSDLPESPDLVGIIVPYHQVLPVLKQSADVGAGAAIVVSAGFAERGSQEGNVLQDEIGDFAAPPGFGSPAPTAWAQPTFCKGSGPAPTRRTHASSLARWPSCPRAEPPLSVRSRPAPSTWAWAIPTSSPPATRRTWSPPISLTTCWTNPRKSGRLLHRGLKGRTEVSGRGEEGSAPGQEHCPDQGRPLPRGRNRRPFPHGGSHRLRRGPETPYSVSLE